RAHVLGGGRAMSVELSHQLAHPDSRNEFNLVVSEQLPPGEAMILGLARAAIASGSREAGFTILVGRNVEGMGLGRHLMRRLARWARGKRRDALQGDIPQYNGPLLELALSVGFAQVDGADPGFVRVRLPLAEATPSADIEARVAR